MTLTQQSRAATADIEYHYADLPRLISLMTGDEKHSSAAESTLDVLWVLYDSILQVSPSTAHEPTRDRFYLSKGHGPMAYYAILAAKRFFPVEWLDGWATWDSPLGQHPDRNLVPGVEISSGSLGHGLPLSVGTALGLKAQGLKARGRSAQGLKARGRSARVVVLVGDAELDEGSNHEAIELAGALGLDNLTVVVVDNSSSTYNRPGRIEQRFATEGWTTVTVDGRNRVALELALQQPTPGRPLVVVAQVEAKS